MATTQEAIARLRMIFETQGADAAVAEMKKLETAETSLGQSSLNLDRAFGNLEKRYIEGARATAEYERAMRTVNAAVAQNPALTERAATVTASLTARYQAQMATIRQAQQGQTAFGVGMQALSAQAQAASASTGILGSMLGTFGRVGTVAAVGLGATVLAFKKLDDGVDAVAQRARQISEFGETTGLTTKEVQGLGKEAARFGISTEQMQTGLQRFVSQMDEFRQGGGQLLEVVRSIDAGLAEQMQQTQGTGDQLRLLQKVLDETTDAFKKARLERAAFGRGGLALGQMDFGAGMQRTSGIPEEMIDQLKRLQGEIDTLGTNISNRIYASFGEPWLKSKLSLLEYVDTWVKSITKLNETAKEDRQVEKLNAQTNAVKELQAMVDRLQKSIDESGGKGRMFLGPQVTALELYKQKLEEAKKSQDQLLEERMNKMLPMPKEEPPLPGREDEDPTVIARKINEYKQLQSVLGNLMPVEQQVALATLELKKALSEAPTEFKQQIEAAMQSLLALKQVQAELSQVEPGTYQRQLEQIQAIKAEYPGLVAQDAIHMRQLDDQLRIAQALPGVARMEAQEQVRINQLLLEGKTLETATAIAGKERAVVQAQINTQAQQQLVTLRNQAAGAAAVTGADKIRAQEQATINELLQQGVDKEIAGAVAAQQRANAEAQVNANIERQVIALNESTQLIEAQIADMQDQAGAAQKVLGIHEIMVRTQQAYTQAIREGASEEKASALAAATYNNLLAQRYKQEVQIAEAKAQQAQQEYKAAQNQYQQEADALNQRMASAQAASQTSLDQQVRALAQAGSQSAQNFVNTILNSMYASAALWNLPMMQDVISKGTQEVANIPRHQRNVQAQDQLEQLRQEYLLGGASSDQDKAQIQWQITYERLTKDGVNASLARQIADQELANTMQQLAKSVDANTSALQAQLDPIYTEGRAALRIGYYGEGAGGTMHTVTGTGWGTSPLPQTPANVNTPAQPSSPSVVVVNNNFPPGAVMGDRRTQYLAANGYGRAIKSTSA